MAVTHRRLLVVVTLILLAATGSVQAQTCTPPTVVQIGGSNPSCAGQPVTFDAGPGWATYAWSNGATTRIITDTPSATTSYSVTVTDGNGCSVMSSPAQVIVTSNPAPPPINVRDSTMCREALGEAWTSIYGTLEWSISGGTFTPGSPTNVDYITFTADGSDPVVLSLTNTENGCSTTSQMTVNVSSPATPVITPEATSLCAGRQSNAYIDSTTWQGATWTITNGVFLISDHYGYLESPTAGGTSVLFRGNGNGPITLAVRAYGSDNCLSPEATVQISLRTIAAPTIITEVDTICPWRQTIAGIEPPAEGNWEGAMWSITNGVFMIYDPMYGYRDSDTATGTNVSYRIFDTGPAVLTVRAYDNFGCMSPEATKQITQRTVAAPTIITEVDTICPWRQTIAGIEPPAEGSWEGAMWSITNGVFMVYDPMYGGYRDSDTANGTHVSYRIFDTGPAVLTVRAYDNFGCMSPEATKQITVRTVAAPTIITEVDTVCPGRQTIAGIEPPAEGNWEGAMWSITNGVFMVYDPMYGGYRDSDTANGMYVSYRVFDTGPATLTVRAHDNFGCMSPEATKQITVRTVAAPTIITEVETICPGRQSIAGIEPPAEGNWEGAMWSITNGVFMVYDLMTGTWQDSNTASGLYVSYRVFDTGPATLTVRAYDNFGCMSPEATKQITVRTVAAPTILTDVEMVCAGRQTVAGILPPAEGNWEGAMWSITNGVFMVYDPVSGDYHDSNVASGTSVSYRATGGGPVTLTVRAYDNFGCMSPDATKQVALRVAAPPVIVPSDTTVCPNGESTASVEPPAEGSWQQVTWSITNGYFRTGPNTIGTTSNDPSVTFFADGAGTVTLTARGTDSFGCTSPDAAAQVALGTIDATITASGPTQLCPGATVTLTATDGAAWTWSNGATTRSIVVAEAGTFSVTVTGVNGCRGTSAPVTVTTAPAPEPVTINAATTMCPGSSAVAGVQENASYASYFWSIANGTINGANNEYTVNFTTGGSGETVLTLVATDASGCSTTDTHTVTIGPPSAVFTLPATVCAPGGYTITVPPDAASYEWSVDGPGFVYQNALYLNPESGPVSVTLTVTGAGGCTASHTVTTQNNSIPALAISAPPAVCSRNGNSASIDAGYTYQWSITNGTLTSDPTQSSVTWNASPAASQVTVGVMVSGGGCQKYFEKTIAIDNFTASISAGGPTSFCAGGSVTLTANAGSSWLWSNGATTQSITVSATGTYDVTVTNANGCIASASQSVSVTTPTATITPNGPTTYCQGGMVTLTANEGASYLWSPIGVTARSLTIGGSGTYTVTVTTADGCSATSAPVQLTENPRPVFPRINTSINGSYKDPSTLCEGDQLDLTASPYGPGVTYLWSTGETTQAIRVTTSAVYSVQITSPEGCPVSVSADLTFRSNPVPTITASGATTFCEGGSVTLTGPEAATYSWMLNGSALPGGATTRAITVTQGGSYTLAVVYASGCSAQSNPVTVTVNPPPVPDIHVGYLYDENGGSGEIVAENGDTYQICGNPSLRLISTILNPAFTYGWSTGASTAFLDVTTSGTYTLTVTNTEGCSASTSVTLNFNPYPAKPVVSAPATQLCPAGGSVTLTAPLADTYEWMLNGSALPSGATTRSIVVTDVGAYRVRVTSNLCQSPWSDDVTITRGQSAITAGGTTDLCANGSVTLTANAGDSYLWMLNGSALPSGATTRSIVVSAPGTYSVAVTINGCTMETSAPVTVTQRSMTITAGGPTTFCNGGSVTLTASPASSYSWSNGATTQSITVFESGNYSVTGVFADGCSILSAPVAVEARQLAATITAGTTTICEGGSIAMQLSSVSGGSGYTYQWYQGMTYTPIEGATSTTYTHTPATSGFVYLKVTDALGCEVNSNSIIYQVLPPPNAAITAPAAICAGGFGDASVPDGGAGTTYSWSAVNASIMGSGNAVGFTYTGGGDVTLTVTVTNAGCSRTTSRTVTVNALPNTPQITPSGPTSFCTGGTVRLSAPAGYTYEWSNGSTQPFIDVTTTSTHSVTVINANGCRATSAETVVTVTNYPNTPQINASGPTTFCQGGTVRLTAPAGYTYEWSNGSTQPFIDVTASGSYRVTVTNAGGCSATSAYTVVTVNPSTVITQQPYTGPVARNTSRRLQVFATGTGTLSFQWQKGTSLNGPWSPVGTNSSIYDTPRLGKGTYWYRVIVTGSCGSVTSNVSVLTVN